MSILVGHEYVYYFLLCFQWPADPDTDVSCAIVLSLSDIPTVSERRPKKLLCLLLAFAVRRCCRFTAEVTNWYREENCWPKITLASVWTRLSRENRRSFWKEVAWIIHAKLLWSFINHSCCYRNWDFWYNKTSLSSETNEKPKWNEALHWLLRLTYWLV